MTLKILQKEKWKRISSEDRFLFQVYWSRNFGKIRTFKFQTTLENISTYKNLFTILHVRILPLLTFIPYIYIYRDEWVVCDPEFCDPDGEIHLWSKKSDSSYPNMIKRQNQQIKSNQIKSNQQIKKSSPLN